MNKKQVLFLLLILSLLNGLLTFLPPLLTGYFFLTFDGALDLLWAKNQLVFLKPALLGPAGSLTGVFFGPFWLWFLGIIMGIFGEDPRLLFLISGLIFYFINLCLIFIFLRRHSPLLAYLTSIFYLTCPLILKFCEYSIAHHLLVPLTFLFIYSLTKTANSFNKRFFFLACLSLSLMFHAEPATMVFSVPALPIILFFSPFKKYYLKLKILFLGLMAFFLPFLPHLLFEVKHQFIQTQAVISYFKGQNSSLGGILPFKLRFKDRLTKFGQFFIATIYPKNSIVSFFLLVFTFLVNTFFVKQSFLKKLWQTSLLYLLVLWLSFLFFPPELKGFYLEGLTVIYLLWFSLAVNQLWSVKKYQNLILIFLLFFILNNSPIFRIKKDLNSAFGGRDKQMGIFKVYLAVVDQIYQDAQNQGFQVYTFDPAIYDYSYQYLFFWRGLQKYGYLPAEFSYLPQVPEYVPLKRKRLAKLQEKIKPTNGLIYLIIQPEKGPFSQTDWLNNFPYSSYPLKNRWVFSNQTIVEKRQASF